MTQALNVSRLVRVTVNLAPLGAARRSFGSLLIVGDTAVINTTQRIRTYTTLEGVLEDFSLSDPEYEGAALYFGQSPRPQVLYIGRWDNPAETAVEAVLACAEKSGDWYGVTFCAASMPDDDAILDVAEYIEAATPSRILGVTTTNTDALDVTVTNDLSSLLKDLNRKRTCIQYSDNEFAICSYLGRAFSVNFNANRSTITMMYKVEPGVIPADLTETQASTLKEKRCNVFVSYSNNTAIIQYGVMSGQAYFDEVHGLDWFADALQTAEYNLLYQSKTKIPQTDAGQNQLVNTAAKVCSEAINNGLIAPGTWNADSFGQLTQGDYLTEGFYIYTQPMALQDQAIREQRIAPPIQIALKLAGAVHELDCIVDVNR
tara:strand:+ start:1412 stop:2533 length:1122 start_codon:yes stop_codon:yes gene_type:complete